jgi:homogentisate 1,2-dioxygenase
VQENLPRRILEEQMTIMVESSRTFLWTEYARKGCGCLSQISTDPRMWDKLPVSFFLLLEFYS